MIKWLLATIAGVFLSGCADIATPKEKVVIDQEVRAKLFQECLKILPAGPKSTHYNDWDEVVRACDNSAFYASQRTVPYKEPSRPHWRNL